jgi:hypothetical protein
MQLTTPPTATRPLNSHSFEADEIPSAKMTYDLSPLQILVAVSGSASSIDFN